MISTSTLQTHKLRLTRMFLNLYSSIGLAVPSYSVQVCLRNHSSRAVLVDDLYMFLYLPGCAHEYLPVWYNHTVLLSILQLLSQVKEVSVFMSPLLILWPLSICTYMYLYILPLQMQTQLVQLHELVERQVC